MKKRIRKAVLIGTFLAGIAFTVPVGAQSIALSDLENSTLKKMNYAEKNAGLDKNHWAYKTLKDIHANYAYWLVNPAKNLT
ncbi:MAG TPA: hypothetical protein P5556_08900 [Candidatus Gastranaerophilales bacterium]|nr:hypothetical protein [Candidatus Gastranaerophilales bacterium]